MEINIHPTSKASIIPFFVLICDIYFFSVWNINNKGIWLLPEKVVTTPSAEAHEIFVEGAATREQLDVAESFAALRCLAGRIGNRQRQQQHQTRLHLQKMQKSRL